MDRDRFIQQLNIERYQKLLQAVLGEVERRVICKLLEEEQAKLQAAIETPKR